MIQYIYRTKEWKKVMRAKRKKINTQSTYQTIKAPIFDFFCDGNYLIRSFL